MVSPFQEIYADRPVSERRSLTRFAVSAPVRLVMDSGESSVALEAEARNLSANGAYIVLRDSRLEVGDRASVEIILPVARFAGGRSDDSCIVGCGTVLRIESGGVALSFDPQLRFA